MKKNIQILLVFVAFFCVNIVAQQKNILIESFVKDSTGKPISNALVYGKEGAQIVKTKTDGSFKISIPEQSQVLIEADGYEPRVLKQTTFQNIKDIFLKPTPYMLGTKDDVNIAFGLTKRANLLGDISVVQPTDFGGYDNTQNVMDALIGRVSGIFGSGNIRGLGNAMVVLNGIPRYSKLSDINLNLEEIDQISVLKDIGAVALYGVDARNGVIIITTKKGTANKRTINITVQQGIATPKALPKYLGSADYMELYNEACINDGLPMKFNATTINNYRNGNKFRYPNIDYYSSEFLKSYFNNSKVLAEFSGGNENTTFYANVGWTKEGSIMNFGEGKNSNNHRFNTRANIDIKITDYIKSSIDVAGVFSIYNGTSGNNYFSSASTVKPYEYSPLLPISLIQGNLTNTNLLAARKNDIDGNYILGGSSQFKTNPFADSYVGGTSQTVRRTMQFNNVVEFDLRNILKGLKFKTNICFDYYNTYYQTVANSYSIYEPTWSASSDTIIGLKQYGTDSRPGTQSIISSDFYRRTAFLGQFDYVRTFSKNHTVNATLLAFTSNVKINGTLQEDKNNHLGLRVAYNYKNSYYLDFSSAYVSSVLLPEGNRGGFSPTLSLGWVISNESFLKQSNVIDFLKFKTSAGVINSDNSIPYIYYYDNVYANSGTYNWDDGAYNNSGTISRRGANSSLGYEKRKEINVGLEGVLFNKSLSLDVNLFSSQISDKISQRNNLYPAYFTGFIPYSNYGIDSYSGVEFSLNYRKKIGEFTFDLGIVGMYWASKVLEKDELYAENYMYRTGKPIDAIFGLVSEGFFKDVSDIKGHAFQTFGNVSPGDVKYKDMNNDGIIDNNDQIQIGRSQAPLSGGINFKVSYKNFTLFATGDGSLGSNSFLSGSYYNPTGDDKYSVEALNRWTTTTSETAKYPRLTTKSNSNNSQVSTLWMYSNDYFNINRIQLTYDFSEKICNKLDIKHLSIYLSAANIATISKNTSITYLNIGSDPQYRNFSLGVRSNF
jgi:TonB-linked SusC/RagA family outer membrane protein